MPTDLETKSTAGRTAEPQFHIEILKARSDFLAAAQACYVHMPGFVLQGRKRMGQQTVRVGFTCSKKVGNAVARNRAKRRLREIARLGLPGSAKPGWDYVLIGRQQKTASRAFALLQADLDDALRRLHA